MKHYLKRLLFILATLSLLPTVVYAATSWTTGTVGNNIDISKTLSISGAQELQVQVSGETEDGYDFIYIYNTNTNQLIKKLSGVVNEVFTVTSDSIRVRLTTDYSITKSGVTVSIGSPSTFSIINIPDSMRSKDWGFAAGLMDYWFQGTGKHYFVDLSDVTSISSKASNAIAKWELDARNGDLIDGNFRKYLIKELKRTPNGSGGMLIPDGGTFNYIDTEISSAGNRWHDLQWEIKNLHYNVERTINSRFYELDEYTAAFEKATLRLVSNGEVLVNNGIATVNVLEVGIYFRDTYDFVDEDTDSSQFLGCWSKTSPYAARTSIGVRNPKLCVRNSSFRNYNINNNNDANHGDFLIFSNPKNKRIYVNESFDVRVGSTSSGNPYIEKLISYNRSYFGSKKGVNYNCSSYYVCQNFSNGKKIAVRKSDNLLYMQVNKKWYRVGYVSL